MTKTIMAILLAVFALSGCVTNGVFDIDPETACSIALIDDLNADAGITGAGKVSLEGSAYVRRGTCTTQDRTTAAQVLTN